MTLSDPKTPRHMRLFELMRQQDVAVSRASRAKALPARRLGPAELEQVKLTALRSFPAPRLTRSDRP
ncbi:hypothetical protein ACERZ8_15430 [Tateyamaria armeniaca]|uniref:Uncharacterized protein n=1 Tax=Tateyamaria armeniaca TaxID=2518930 RepID=A0ABW8UZX1_9RHOB